jgi:hypothetical protein
MLAYVFWHWPNADHTAAEYEQAQREFHATLARSAPTGFLGSACFRLDGQAPWLSGAPAYADWYLVADSAALDPLNVSAVSGICEAPHAKVAHAMAAGAGSLFTLRGDASVDLAASRQLTFLTKPREMAYANFYPSVAVVNGATLWRRTMVLGPTPEFALLSTDPTPQAIEQFHPVRLALAPIT